MCNRVTMLYSRKKLYKKKGKQQQNLVSIHYFVTILWSICLIVFCLRDFLFISIRARGTPQHQHGRNASFPYDRGSFICLLFWICCCLFWCASIFALSFCMRRFDVLKNFLYPLAFFFRDYFKIFYTSLVFILNYWGYLKFHNQKINYKYTLKKPINAVIFTLWWGTMEIITLALQYPVIWESCLHQS